MTQVIVAKKVHITERQYQRYEAGDNEPTLSVLLRLADLFDVSLDYLAGRSDSPDRI
ncbi:MAG: helix-turn-helix domain-containing protein [Oscillospiraceae bacterium]|nr:helix-turn-helix domain-containing protein [Oscillospiraceae bacterium]